MLSVNILIKLGGALAGLSHPWAYILHCSFCPGVTLNLLGLRDLES